MSLWAVTMVKNERDIILPVLHHLLDQGVDRIIVADNLSTDGTLETLQRFSERHPVEVVIDNEPTYFQAEKMSRLVHLAGERGAEWIIPFDADEIWFSAAGRLRDVIMASDADVLVAPVFNHHVSIRTVLGRNVFERMRFREPLPSSQPKVAFRYSPTVRVAQGNHSVSGAGEISDDNLLEIRHFQFRSFRQFRRKVITGAKAYDSALLDPAMGGHWRRLGSRSRLHLAATWIRHHFLPNLVDDIAPIDPLIRDEVGLL